MKAETALMLAQKRMWLLLKMQYGQESKELTALLQVEPRESDLRKAYQKIDDAIAEIIVAESRIIAAVLQKQRQAL